LTRKELITISVMLLSLAALLHFAHYLIFHDAHHVLIYLFGDIAFLPIEILVISVVVDRVLREREREAVRDKMNMVVGTFFSALGRPLLDRLPEMLADPDEVLPALAIAPDWDAERIRRARNETAELRLRIRPTADDFEDLRQLLHEQRDFLLRLLENPSLLERDEFTELLWAISHVQEELGARGDVHALPESDFHHLCGDVNRLYAHLVREWLDYMMHLNTRYPFLYSFASRTNPLRPDADVTVRE